MFHLIMFVSQWKNKPEILMILKLPGFRSHSAHRRMPSPEPNPPTPPRANLGFPPELETPAGPRPAEEPAADGKRGE